MKISQALADKMRAIGNARTASTLMPSLVSPEAVSAASKAVWAAIRSTYNLPKDGKFKVSTTEGNSYGELRWKETGEVYEMPVRAGSMAFAPPQAPQAQPKANLVGGVVGDQRFLVVDDDTEVTVTGVDQLAAHLRAEYDIRVIKL